MGTEVNSISIKSGTYRGNKTVSLEKKDEDGQVHKLTVTIFDRNKSKNPTPENGIRVDSADGVGFEGDRAFFNAKEIAANREYIFGDYVKTDDEFGSIKDSDVSKTTTNGKLSDITLSSTPVNLGKFLDALDELDPNASGQATQGGRSAAGAQGAGAGAQQMPSYTNPFQLPPMPDARGMNNFIDEASFREVMCLPDSYDAIACAASGAVANKALGAIFDGYFQRMKVLARNDYGNGGYGAPSGASSFSNPVDAAAAQKTADEAKKAADDKKADESKKAATLEKAKKAREKEVTDIVNNAYTSIKNPGGIGTDNEKLLATVNKINKENVLEVLEAWEKSKCANELGEKSLVKLIGDVTDGWSNIENLYTFAPSHKYLNPIKDALKERSDSAEASQIAGIADSNYASHLKWNDSKAIENINELYEQVKKESKENLIKDPLEVRVEADIKSGKDKVQAETKEKADAKKAEKDAKKAEDARIAKAVEDAKKAAATKKSKKKPTKAELDKIAADEKAKIDSEKVDKVQKAANEKAQKEADKKREQEVKEANKIAQAEYGPKKEQPGFFRSLLNRVTGGGKKAPKLTRDKNISPVEVKQVEIKKPELEAEKPEETP